jgi:hypothetical protein
MVKAPLSNKWSHMNIKYLMHSKSQIIEALVPVEKVKRTVVIHPRDVRKILAVTGKL